MAFFSTVGENIKRIRKEKGVTQETLAARLGLSCQAVSKWERGESMPDVSYIVPIANFFRVSADDLLGLSPARREQTIKAYLEELAKLAKENKSEDYEALLEKAYLEYPDDYRIMDLRLTALFNAPIEENAENDNKDELYTLCQQILSGCPIEKIRFHAIDVISELFAEDGETDRAIALLSDLPGAFDTNNHKIQLLFEEGDPQRLVFARKNIAELLEALILQVRATVREDSSLKRADQLNILKKCVALVDTFITEGDYGFFHYHLSDLYFRIANRYMMAKDAAPALDALSKAFYHAKCYDALPEEYTHISPLLAGHVFRRSDRPEVGYVKKVNEQFEYLETTCKPIFAPVADTPIFQDFLKQYK